MTEFKTVYCLSIWEMIGKPDRPQMVLDYIDMIWKAIYGEVLR